MVKKNYLSRAEQEIWGLIGEKEIIDSALIREIFPEWNARKTNKLLYGLSKKKYLERAKRDLYYNPQKLRSFYTLALKIKSGYIGLSSALKHCGLLDYEDFTISVMTNKFRKKMELKGTQYSIEFIPLKEMFFGFERKDGLYFSSIEKTFFDCFLKPSHVGFYNITKALYTAKLDWQKFVDMYKKAKNNSLCQRTGYILELMRQKTRLRVPGFVFDFLLKSVKTPVRLASSRGKSIFNKRWKIQDNIGTKNILGWYQ